MAVNKNMNTGRRAYEVLQETKRRIERSNERTGEDSKELIDALNVALPLVEAAIPCDRCGRKAAELSDTGMSYCRRCWKAVTDGRTPY